MKFVYLLLISASISLTICQKPRILQGCRRKPDILNIKITKNNVVDLTHVMDERTFVWPTATRGYEMFTVFKGFITATVRFFLQSYSFFTPEHSGTHMDAPSHFYEDKSHTDEVGFDSIIGRGVLIDLTKNNTRYEKDGRVTIDDILAWEIIHGRMRSGSIVLLYTGYSNYYYDRPVYMGTNLTGAEGEANLHFPGLHEETTEWLVNNRCIAAIGIDTPSMDYGQSKNYPSHRILCKSDIPIFENVANLKKLADAGRGFKVIALPLKLKGGSGSPVRIIAALN
uniref:isatin hydrolase-like n=1 Tax=Styela clava TaxID=7725 RepID=UPI0019395A55|nr:isatin hydrolase-like [Styela clava]